MGRSPGEGKGYPPQYCGLENSLGCIVHGVAKNRTRPSDFHLLTYLHWRLVTPVTFPKRRGVGTANAGKCRGDRNVVEDGCPLLPGVFSQGYEASLAGMSKARQSDLACSWGRVLTDDTEAEQLKKTLAGPMPRHLACAPVGGVC